MRAQIANLIISGSSKKEIRSITGIGEEAFEELLADASFAAEIRDIRESKKEEEIEKHYSALELKAIKAVEESISFYDAQSLCRVMETVARTRVLKKQAAHPIPNNGISGPTINITLPTFVGTSQMVMDSKKQVIAIDGRNMAPLPTAQVKQLFQKLDGESHDQDPILADAAEREAQAAPNAAAA